MMRLVIIFAVVHCTVSQQYQQKVAPGVPPQNYQKNDDQQPPPQQPINVQHAQPSHGGHHGEKLENELDPQLLNPANIAQERDHIKEHMEVPIDTSKMSEQELQFHYFKMHDSDNNNKLDGCELIKSLIHWHEENEPAQRLYKDSELQLIMDKLLAKTDFDSDGAVSWTEFRIVGGSVDL